MRLLYILVMLLPANSALSATVDGSLTIGNKGTASLNSHGSFDINVTKGDAVQISNLNSIVITGGSSSADRTASDDVCYYATTSQYSVDMNSTNPPGSGGKMILVNSVDSSKKTPYELEWDDGKNDTVDATFTRNSDAEQTFNSNNRSSANCQTTGGTNARITVIVKNASYSSMSTGLYTDTVLITLKAK